MMHEQFLVTTTKNGKDSVKIWDASSPLGLGAPFRWMLERTAAGVRVRSLQPGASGVRETKVFRVGSDDMTATKAVQLEPGVTLQLRPAVKVRAAYLGAGEASPEVLSGRGDLFVFSGVRRLPLRMDPVYGAYVAYFKGLPAFTVYHNAEGIQIKPLVNGIRLKLRGKPSIAGEAGKPWTLTRDHASGATLSRGWYWWRLAQIVVPEVPVGWGRGLGEIEDSGMFRKLGLGLLALFVLMFLIRTVVPEPPPKLPELPPQVVKLKPRSKGQGPAKGSAKATAGTGEKTGKMQVKKAPPAMPEPPKMAKAPAPAKAPPAAKAPAAPAKPKASVALNYFKNSFRSAFALSRPGSSIDKAAKSPTGVNPISGTGAITGSANIGSGSTKVRATYSGGDADVAGIGSGGTGPGGIGGKPGSAGYGSDVSGGLYKGKGGAFASLDTGGSTVEEGLTKEEVGAVIHAHLDEIRYCHEASMLVDPKSSGKSLIQFRISPQGVVETANVQSSTVTEKGLEGCVMRRLKTWRFPRPKGGVKVTVSYPFLFRVLGRE